MARVGGSGSAMSWRLPSGAAQGGLVGLAGSLDRCLSRHVPPPFPRCPALIATSILRLRGRVRGIDRPPCLTDDEPGDRMAQCEVCHNQYDKTFQVVAD